MKTKQLCTLLAVALVSAALGWFAAPRAARPAPATSTLHAQRKLLYYQSAMHPWIKSDKPGRCTICGMELTPVYEGDAGFDASNGTVALGSNVIQVVGVQTEEVRRQPLRRSFRFAGTIDDNDARHRIVSAYVDGRIDALNVNFVGAEVVAGQPLATLYSRTLLAAEREYVALRRAGPGAPTPLQAEQQRLQQAALERLVRFGLTRTQIEALEHKSENEAHSELLAPLTGTVIARFVYEGQYITEGNKLFEIADFSTMWFVFDAYERDLPWLKVGQSVEVTTPSVPGRTFTGTITFIDPTMREMTRTANVRVELSNPLVEQGGQSHRALYHKLYAEAVVRVASVAVLAVPRSAVLSPGGQPILYVDKGGAYEPRAIRLGRVGDEMFEVLEGVAEGERVVTTGNLLIDAQAQLNQTARPSTTSTTAAPSSVSEATPAFSDAQRASITTFLSAAHALADALASDNLAAFNEQAARVHGALPALLEVFDQNRAWQPQAERLEATSHFEKAADLAAARKAFLPFSTAVVNFAARLRQQPAFRSVKIYECPMVNRAVPGAPKTGQWLQLQGPLRNPYFGAEMLDCGTELKP
jgi:Cu(I)/Ag(I) efflux system membrane fusion protein